MLSPMQRDFWIPSLDGFRAVAILLVFLSHAGLGYIVPGGLGVTVFFFLSGYLITTLLRREFARSHDIDLKAFYLRRVARIWPAFYVVLIVGNAATLLGLLPGELHTSPLASQYLHFSNYWAILFGPSGQTAGTGVFWSLAVEEHFYLAFPALFLLLLRTGWSGRRQALFILGLCALVLVWRVVLVQFGASTDRTYYASDTRIDSLLFGCSLAIFGNPVVDGAPRYGRILKHGFVPLGVALLVASLVFRSAGFRETFRYTLQGIALLPVFMAAVAFPNWSAFRVLNLKWVRGMGAISFSFYLVHFTMIEAVNAHAGGLSILVRGGLAFALSVSAAYVLHRLVEGPAGKAIRGLRGVHVSASLVSTSLPAEVFEATSP